MLHTAQDLSYTTLASVNPEASDWRPAKLEAHAAFSQCGFLCVAVSSLRVGCVESRKTRRFP